MGKTSANLDMILGALIGIAATMLLTTSRWFWANGLEKYQGLLSGCLTLIGAAAAVGVVIRQINHAQEMENKRRERRMYAARAMMSHSLASLCDYAQRSCAELREMLGDARPPKDPEQVKLPDDFKTPEVSTLPLEPLQQLLQFGDEDIQSLLAKLMSHLQIQQSRIRNRSGHVIDNIIFARWYYPLIADSLEIYARASSLLDYARYPAAKVPDELTKDNFYSAAHHCEFLGPKWDELNKFIDQERPQP
jgi:hypothetical protein